MITILYIILAYLIITFGLVGIGLFFKKDLGYKTFKDGTVIQNYELPDWLKWLQNPEDNLTGDKRGWYWNIYMAGRPAWWKMLIWSAWRNPWNWLKRIGTGCDVRTHTITKLCGANYVRDDFDNTGFQILLAKPEKGITKPAVYWVRRWGQSNRAIVVQLGWKIKLEHNGVIYSEEDKYDYYKGWTIEIQTAKDIS